MEVCLENFVHCLSTVAIAGWLIGCSSTSGDATATATVAEGVTQSPGQGAPPSGHDKPPQAGDDAVELTIKAGGRSQHVVVSAVGSIAQIDADADAGSTALKAVVNYRSGQVLLEAPADQTYSTLTLAEYVAEQQPITSIQGTLTPVPKQTVDRTDLERKIAGLSARAYLATNNGTTTRVWYSEDLPLPPANVRKQLAAIGPVASDDGADDRGCKNERGRPPVTAEELAGRTVLRTETEDASGQWTITSDTLAAKRTLLTAVDFAVPSGFTITPLPSLPSSVNQAFNDPIECSASGQPATDLDYNGGDTLGNVHVYMNYYGLSFASDALSDPTGFNSVYSAGVSQVFTPEYLGGLRQYGIESGQVVETNVTGFSPPGAFSDPASDIGTVMALQVSGAMPSLWWRTDKYAPLAFLVFDDNAAPSSSGAGYHFVAPSVPWAYLPFPLNLAAYPIIPYAAVVFPTAALPLSAAALTERDELECGGSCYAIAALDEGTEAMSHELVEAITDPFPFSGWANLSLDPVWFDGEIADICDSACIGGATESRVARVGNTVLSTYWSNSAGACVPTWPTISLFGPNPGLYSLTEARAGLTGDVFVSNPIERGDRLSRAVTWFVDGATQPFFDARADGTEVFNTIQIDSTGQHTITARYLDESASATINVRDSRPVVSIDSPAAGASYPLGTTITLFGHGTSADEPDGISPEKLFWVEDNVLIGTGKTLATTLNRPGDVTFVLESEDQLEELGTASVTIHVTQPAGAPTVRITSPSSGFEPTWDYSACDYYALTCPITVTFSAVASNADGTAIDPSEIQWSDPEEGSLGTGASITHTFTVPLCANSSATVTATASSAGGSSLDSVLISFRSHGC